MPGKNKKYNLIFAFEMLLSFILIMFWVFAINNFSNLKKDNSEMVRNLEATEKKVRNIKQFETLFSKLDEKRQKIRTSIVLKEDLVKFIENLESLAAHAGVAMQIKSIQVKENSYPLLNIELSGDFNDVYYFIEMLESLPYFISFDRLTIQKNSSQDLTQMKLEGRKEYKWTSKIDLRVLSYHENFQ